MKIIDLYAGILLCSTILLCSCATVEPLNPTSTSPTMTHDSLVEASTPSQLESIDIVSLEESPQSEIAITPNVPDTNSSFEGPLIAFRVQNGRNYLLLLDIGMMTFRELKQAHLDVPFVLEWVDSGCFLYLQGNLVDLQGNIVESLNDAQDEKPAFHAPFLSADKQRGLREVFLGTHPETGLDYISLEILDRMNPNAENGLAPNGGAYAYAWSPDGNWVAFTDYDENRRLQLYRATADGLSIEQITNHQEDSGVITHVEWSPNGQYLAYAVSAPFQSQIETGDSEGWIGLISLPDLQTARVSPTRFSYTKGLWWSGDNNRVMFAGEGGINDSSGDQKLQTQLYWADRRSGVLLNSFSEEQAPTGYMNLIAPAGNIDSIFFGAKDGYYLLDANTNTVEKVLDEIPTDGLIRDFSASPFEFPSEAECSLE